MKILYEGILTAFNLEQKLYDENDKDSLFRMIDVEPPQYIDLYDSQPEMPDQFEGFMCPAVCLDYQINWVANGAIRTGTLILEAHVLTDPMGETSNLYQDSQMPDGLKKIDYYETINTIIEGITTEETGKLILTGERPVSTDYFNYHVLTYECSITRKINNGRKYEDGTIEKVDIKGNIKKKYDFYIND